MQQVIIRSKDVGLILSNYDLTKMYSIVITGWSTPKPMTFGHSYVMKSWDDPPNVVNDPEVPPNGFGFKNGMSCSAVVSMRDPLTKQFVPSQFLLIHFVLP